MKRTVRLASLCCSLVILSNGWTAVARSADEGSSSVRRHAEQSFQQMKQPERSGKPKFGAGADATIPENVSHYSSDQYVIGKGQGDLSKGRNVCQRVSELSARTDLAKQIRVMVKEHMIDHVRTSGGKEPEQDIELTREEIVQEYLQGVTIVDRQIDEGNKTCSATAIMPKRQIQPTPASDQPGPISTIPR